MAKKIAQLRYYGEGAKSKNNTNLSDLSSGEAFTKYLPITQLGIQTLPGVKFYLNNTEKDPIIIGSTGIYELDLEGISEITNISFPSGSLKNINNTNNAYLIIDMVYEG